ncbi:MAG: hypothetical protein GKR87_01510 [Kiritimatiellae bacterium]|nr:hypothetical protein [Kiritimatiellia bacterium]
MSNRTIQTEIFRGLAELQQSVVDLLSSEWQGTRSLETSNAIMLPGGKTPLTIYQQLTQKSIPAPPHQHILLSDERMVSIDSPESNFSNLAPMLTACEFKKSQILRIKTERSPAEAAHNYGQQLSHYLNAGGRISLGILGLGTDGHTASLFTEQDLFRGMNDYAIDVTRPDTLKGISVTPHLLSHIEKIIFLVSGKNKTEMIRILQNDPVSIVAGQAVSQCRNVQIWTDRPTIENRYS